MNEADTVNIIGAGLAGLSAALSLAKRKIPCNLVSLQPSERAQSNLAEGGINGVLNTMGEDDRIEYHIADTIRAGCELADPEAVRGLAEHAPQIIRELAAMGVPFNRSKGRLLQRNFGGQKKKRTAFAQSSTGKMITTALIDAVRRYETQGLIRRYDHHELVRLILTESECGPEGGNRSCAGAVIRDANAVGEVFGSIQDRIALHGPVILATGGLNGFFAGRTTGTTANSGDAAATVYAQGVTFSNLEMIQYHPTTFAIAGKRCLITEAARGEGGRLYRMRGGQKWYFMEEKYPELGNLMPRDVVSREIYFVLRDPACEGPVYLDMTGLSGAVWKQRLSDLREEIRYYTGLDAAKEPVPVAPGIHYFMGGIDVTRAHATNIPGLFAAGECCSQYHGANRLGGNSMLGAIYGGRCAAESAAEYRQAATENIGRFPSDDTEWRMEPVSEQFSERLCAILSKAMGIVRNQTELEEGLTALDALGAEALNQREKNRLLLTQAIVRSALERKESRGAHYREDYPDREEAFGHLTKKSLKKI